jgi:hypothetical protein
MRLISAGFGVLLAALALHARPAAAQTYPWCAVDMQEGMWTCAFVDRQQCMLDASGIGAYCMENPNYRVAAPGDLRPRVRKLQR